MTTAWPASCMPCPCSKLRLPMNTKYTRAERAHHTFRSCGRARDVTVLAPGAAPAPGREFLRVWGLEASSGKCGNWNKQLPEFARFARKCLNPHISYTCTADARWTIRNKSKTSARAQTSASHSLRLLRKKNLNIAPPRLVWFNHKKFLQAFLSVIFDVSVAATARGYCVSHPECRHAEPSGRAL